MTKEKATEIAADFMTTFYHVQVGALETQEFRTQPVPFWLVCFSDTVKGPIKNMFFVVLLPDGTVVVPRWRSGCRRARALSLSHIWVLRRNGRWRELGFLRPTKPA